MSTLHTLHLLQPGTTIRQNEPSNEKEDEKRDFHHDSMEKNLEISRSFLNFKLRNIYFTWAPNSEMINSH